MRITYPISYLLACLLSVALFSGCPSTESEPPADDEVADSHAGHDHSSHDTGPHGGHFFHLTGLDLECEWSHDDDQSNVRIHFLNEDHSDAFVDAEKVVIISEGRETIEYELLPEAEPNEEGKYSTYVIKSVPLLGAMSAGVHVQATIDGKAYTGEITPHIH